MEIFDVGRPIFKCFFFFFHKVYLTQPLKIELSKRKKENKNILIVEKKKNK